MTKLGKALSKKQHAFIQWADIALGSGDPSSLAFSLNKLIINDKTDTKYKLPDKYKF